MPLDLKKWDVIKIPLIGTSQSRLIDTATTSSASSGVVGIGVVGTMIVGKTIATTKDQHFINVLPEKVTNEATGNARFYLTKRPGFAAHTTPSAGNVGSAIHVWAGRSSGTDVISAFGETNSTIYNGTTSLGSTTGRVDFISETLIGTTANLAMTTDSNTAYFYPDGGSLTQITDVDFPGNVAGQTIIGGFVHLNGYTYIMTTSGRIYNSDINSLSAWTSTSWLSTNMKPDLGIGLARYKGYIVGFNQESIEFFEDVGNATGSPLQRLTQATINIGCINKLCYAEMGDTLTWIGTTAESTIGVFVLDGLRPKRISNPLIDAILAGTDPTQLYVNVFSLVGKTYVMVVSVADQKSYVYGLETDLWCEWTSTTMLWHRMAGIGSGTRYIYAVSAASTSGKVYVINPVAYVFQDDSTNYSVTIQTLKFDGNNNNRKFLDRLDIFSDRYSSTNNISIQWSDDDYGTTSTARTVDLSGVKTYVTGCGSFRRRSFYISQSNSMPLRLEGLGLKLRQGSN